MTSISAVEARRQTRSTPLRLALSALIMSLLVVTGSGCSENEPREQNTADIAVKDVPADVMEQAKKALPDVEFEDAWKVQDAEGKLLGYEVRGRNNVGKIREVRISPEGKVLEME